MTDCKALADRLNALGIGQYFMDGYTLHPCPGPYVRTMSADVFCRDGHVVLAAMNRLDAGEELTTICCDDGRWSAAIDYNNVTGDSAAECTDESQAIAILTAICDALEAEEYCGHKGMRRHNDDGTTDCCDCGEQID